MPEVLAFAGGWAAFELFWTAGRYLVVANPSAGTEETLAPDIGGHDTACSGNTDRPLAAAAGQVDRLDGVRAAPGSVSRTNAVLKEG